MKTKRTGSGRARALGRVALAARLILTLGLVLPQAALCQGAPAPVSWNEPDVIPGRVLIKFKAAKGQALRADRSAVGVQGLSVSPLEESVEERIAAEVPGKQFLPLLPNTFVGNFDPAERDHVLRQLAADPDVEYFEPDRVRAATPSWGTAEPNEWAGGLPRDWGMVYIGASNVWVLEPVLRSGVRVAVMDSTTFDTTHYDLVAQVSSVQNNTGPVGDHATAAAGIIAATGNNGQGIVGVANVELAALGPGSSSSGFAAQISWARANQVSVINMSFHWCPGGSVCDSTDCLFAARSQTEQDAISAALGDIVFVAAAGNAACSTDTNGYSPTPASYAGVLGVSAIQMQKELWSQSNHGTYVDLAAPGWQVSSTVPGGINYALYGTSVAAPYVAGSAAAVLAIRNDYDIRSVSRLLELTAEDLGSLGKDESFGFGLVRADRAVAAVADVYAETPPPVVRQGTLWAPYTLTEAIANVPPGGTIGLVRTLTGPFSGPLTITKACTLVAVGGVATIGN